MRRLSVFLVGCWLVGLSLTGSIRVSALTATPSATPAFALVTSADVAFPNAILFELSIALPIEQVERVSLTLGAETLVPLQIEFPARQAFAFADEYVVARYDWRIQDPPPFLSRVDYTWQVFSAQGIYEVAGSLTYVDERLDWQTLGAPEDAIRFIAPAILSERLRFLRPILQQAYALLETHTRQAPRFLFSVYPRGVPFACETDEQDAPITRYTVGAEIVSLPCDLGLAELSLRKLGWTATLNESQINRPQPALQQIFAGFYAPLWTGQAVPAWFQVGLERFYSPVSESGALEYSRQFLRNQRPLSLEQMQEAQIDDEVWRAQAYGMVLLMADKAGVPAIFELARRLESASFTEQYASIMGESLDLLIPSWQTWVYTRRAEQVYGYTPYLDLTATPSATPLPPTPSATPSATPELEPSPTTTPRLRPTRTPIPPTDTATPLPPESFVVRMTPVPNALSETGGALNDRTVISGLAIGLAIVALAALVGFLRRK